MIVSRAPGKTMNEDRWMDGWMDGRMDGWLDDRKLFAISFRNQLSVHILVLCLQSLPSFPLREVHSFILISNLYLSFRAHTCSPQGLILAQISSPSSSRANHRSYQPQQCTSQKSELLSRESHHRLFHPSSSVMSFQNTLDKFRVSFDPLSPFLFKPLLSCEVQVSFPIVFFVLAVPCSMRESQFPDQGLSPYPLQWRRGVLTTGPPGKPQAFPVLPTVFLTVRPKIYTQLPT